MDYDLAVRRLEELRVLVDEYRLKGDQATKQRMVEAYGRVSDEYSVLAGTQRVEVEVSGARGKPAIYPNFFEAGYLSGRTFHTGKAYSELAKVIGLAKERAERAAANSLAVSTPSRPMGNRVFLVHGHNETMLQATARFLEKLDLPPTILREEANRGRTVIEKFEDHASEAGFAVVLLTADDAGAGKTELRDGDFSSLHPRARQNAILELGYFAGRIGRERVCALHEPIVELPSDLGGVLTVGIDPKGAWKFELARELKAAGLSVDMNKAI